MPSSITGSSAGKDPAAEVFQIFKFSDEEGTEVTETRYLKVRQDQSGILPRIRRTKLTTQRKPFHGSLVPQNASREAVRHPKPPNTHSRTRTVEASTMLKRCDGGEHHKLHNRAFQENWNPVRQECLQIVNTQKPQ